MKPVILRLRERNQLTLPPEIVQHFGLSPGDGLVAELSGDTVSLRPLRIAVEGSPRAEQAIERSLQQARLGKTMPLDVDASVARLRREPAPAAAGPVGRTKLKQLSPEEVQDILNRVQRLLHGIEELEAEKQTVLPALRQLSAQASKI